jgi:hypothetical protein
MIISPSNWDDSLERREPWGWMEWAWMICRNLNIDLQSDSRFFMQKNCRPSHENILKNFKELHNNSTCSHHHHHHHPHSLHKISKNISQRNLLQQQHWKVINFYGCNTSSGQEFSFLGHNCAQTHIFPLNLLHTNLICAILCRLINSFLPNTHTHAGTRKI